MNGGSPNTKAEQRHANKLRRLVPAWRAARLRAARIEGNIIQTSRELAAARGVPFIRIEQIEAEFGG